MAELLHEAPPERVRLPDTWIACLFPDRRVDHDEPARRIDVDRLATDAEEHEHPPLAREYPDLIAVAVRSQKGTGTGLEVRLVWAHARCRPAIQAAGMICRPRQFPSWASSSPKRA